MASGCTIIYVEKWSHCNPNHGNRCTKIYTTTQQKRQYWMHDKATRRATVQSTEAIIPASDRCGRPRHSLARSILPKLARVQNVLPRHHHHAVPATVMSGNFVRKPRKRSGLTTDVSPCLLSLFTSLSGRFIHYLIGSNKVENSRSCRSSSIPFKVKTPSFLSRSNICAQMSLWSKRRAIWGSRNPMRKLLW